jgi:hypothetical protein
MKYISLLPDVLLTDIQGEPIKGKGGEQVVANHREFILGRLGDPKWGTSTELLFIAYDIRRTVLELPDDAVALPLENDHHKKLADVTREPSPQAPYNPHVAHNLVPFAKAITDNATDEPPKAAHAPPAPNPE